MNADRLARLTGLLASAGFDALAINPGPSLTYLTGLSFHLMERPVILLIAPPAAPVIVCPELEAGKLQKARVPLQAVAYSDNPATWAAAFEQAVQAAALDGRRVAVEPARMRFLELQFLQDAAPRARFLSGEGFLAQLRLHKDAEEIAAMRQAARIAQRALEITLPAVKAGVSERELASELSANLLRSGSEPEFPFAPIVSFGENSANPHAVPGDRRLKGGDLILIDWGATFQGYCSDITRTFALGKIDSELKVIYTLVQAANAAGRAAGRPGLRAGDVDRAAREVIVRGGYGPQFIHRTGHGLGMEAHETPYIYAENDLPLAAGMVYTVEPGIYLPGKGGVRIEDDVHVTAGGSENLTDFPRELTILS
jgi:Xaa-Pro dipeptidase